MTAEARERDRRVSKAHAETMKLTAALQSGVPSIKTLRLLATQAQGIADTLRLVADDFDARTPEHLRQAGGL